jgi:hypothetical protein
MKIWAGNKNMESFRRMESKLLRKYHGKVAVFSDGNLIATRKDIKQALKKARKVP